MSATDGVTVDHGDDGLRQGAYLLLHVEDVKTWYAVVADIAAASLHVHVATRAERLVAGSGKDDNADALRLTTPSECLRHLPRGARCEGITITRTVDGDLGDAIIFLKQDFLKVKALHGHPISFFHIVVS